MNTVATHYSDTPNSVTYPNSDTLFAHWYSHENLNYFKDYPDNAFTPILSKPEYFRVFAIDPLRFFQAPLFCLPLTLKAD